MCHIKLYTFDELIMKMNWCNSQDGFGPVGCAAVSPGSGRVGAPPHLHGDRLP